MFSGLAGWHALIVFGMFVVPFILWLIAVIQIAAARAAAGPTVGWLILVTLAPFLGAILWFTIGRSSLRRETPPTQAG
ncbi:PLDc N-terminal domain-containing protein [Leifsonia sp. 21MFCrub1.1]|uniref:PLDc N-terminal domain-containing protein n=1 Tax=Leifsonia sp. 21MFCrub1.1 TaxID=1798223 RepID=UPI00089292F5|nr:PLDc N-terminal domain-containing protein [Leifsonia sp. 21MFCrub1.1]SEA75741.1 Phospholipase_D-nuclease N-terminal [Leifsonia sp. 21MFCrub1.1]